MQQLRAKLVGTSQEFVADCYKSPTSGGRSLSYIRGVKLMAAKICSLCFAAIEGRITGLEAECVRGQTL